MDHVDNCDYRAPLPTLPTPSMLAAGLDELGEHWPGSRIVRMQLLEAIWARMAVEGGAPPIPTGRWVLKIDDPAVVASIKAGWLQVVEDMASQPKVEIDPYNQPLGRRRPPGAIEAELTRTRLDLDAALEAVRDLQRQLGHAPQHQIHGLGGR